MSDAARKEGAVYSEFLRTARAADPCAVTSEQTLLSGQAAQFVFDAPAGSVVTLGGIDGAALRELVDQAEHIPDDAVRCLCGCGRLGVVLRPMWNR